MRVKQKWDLPLEQRIALAVLSAAFLLGGAAGCLLAALSGEPHFLPQERQAVLDTPFPKASPGRRFIRGRYECGRVTLPKGHASGVLSSFLGCNCMVDIPAGSEPLERGSRVNIILL